MTAHTHREITPGCYRCELNEDEMNAYWDTLIVVYSSAKVHDPDYYRKAAERLGAVAA